MPTWNGHITPPPPQHSPNPNTLPAAGNAHPPALLLARPPSLGHARPDTPKSPAPSPCQGLSMALQTNVLRGGQWVTETIDIEAVLRANSAPRPPRLRGQKPPDRGVLTTTVVESRPSSGSCPSASGLNTTTTLPL